jgi:hypothetical protein
VARHIERQHRITPAFVPAQWQVTHAGLRQGQQRTGGQQEQGERAAEAAQEVQEEEGHA